MALNFPSNKNTGDTHIENGITFTWNGTVWKRDGNQNVFSKIAVSGQNNVVADGATDTLTLVGTSGVSITTNSSTDTVTFSSSGGSTPAIEVGTRTSHFQTSLESYQTAITVTINPTVSGSTLLVTAAGIMAGYHQSDYDDPTGATPACRVYRGSTAIGQELIGGGIGGAGNYTGYKKDGFNLTFKDTNNHGGNNVTYYLKIRRYNTDEHVHMRKGTTLTIQEII